MDKTVKAMAESRMATAKEALKHLLPIVNLVTAERKDEIATFAEGASVKSLDDLIEQLDDVFLRLKAMEGEGEILAHQLASGAGLLADYPMLEVHDYGDD